MFERLPNPLEQPAIDRQPGHYWVRRKWAYGPGRWVVAEWAREADEDCCCWWFCKTSFGDIECAAIGPRVYEPEPDGGSFGGLISFLISQGFQRVETLNPDRKHRYYLECKLCGGTDELRPIVGSKPAIDMVQHGGACSLAEHLSRLRELAMGSSCVS